MMAICMLRKPFTIIIQGPLRCLSDIPLKLWKRGKSKDDVIMIIIIMRLMISVTENTLRYPYILTWPRLSWFLIGLLMLSMSRLPACGEILSECGWTAVQINGGEEWEVPVGNVYATIHIKSSLMLNTGRILFIYIRKNNLSIF